jgi:Carboxymuconolactone decarboxylase family.
LTQLDGSPVLGPRSVAAAPRRSSRTWRTPTASSSRARSELRGRTLNVYRAIGNHPEVLDGVLAFGKAAYFQNSLTPAQRELAYLGASVANDCHY